MTSLPGQPPAREVLAAPGVAALLLSTFVLTTGVMLQAAALVKHVFDITGDELSIGLVGLAEFLPAALLVLVTGTVADRWARKRVALTAQAGELLCAVLFTVIALDDPRTAAPMILVSVLFGTARAFVAPALRPVAAMIAPAGGLPRVVAMHSAAWTAAAIIGPATSGFLYAADPALAYGTAAVLIALGMVALARVPVPRRVDEPGAPPPTLRHALEGLRFIRRTPVLLAAISLDLFAVLFGGAVALLPVIAEERLGVGDVAYGWLRAAGGIGAGISALVLAVRPVRRRVGPTLLVAVALFGVGSIVLGTTRSFVVAFVAVLAANAADMVSVFIRSSLVPLVTPDDKRGRVTAVENVFIGASNELGAFESGAVSSLVGTPATVIGGGVATLVVAAAYTVAFPALRRVDTFEEVVRER
ncbi:MAG: hypothetical protein RL330_1328 [Actinomycetota bacterium]|jgi:MFS family permease